MKGILRTAISLLLLLNGVGAIYGGWHLVVYPDGSSLKMPLEMLEHSPFHDFLIPGIILFIANGLFSLAVLVTVLVGIRKFPLLVLAQGLILSGWIITQCGMLRAIHYLHVLYGTFGLLLILGGWMLRQMENKQSEQIAKI